MTDKQRFEDAKGLVRRNKSLMNVRRSLGTHDPHRELYSYIHYGPTQMTIDYLMRVHPDYLKQVSSRILYRMHVSESHDE